MAPTSALCEQHAAQLPYFSWRNAASWLATLQTLSLQTRAGVARAALRELDVSWRFIRSDFTTAVVPATVFALAAAVRRPELLTSPSAILSDVLLAVLHSILFLYVHCVSNQLVGIEEDKLSKPFRPLACGKITVAGGWARLISGHILFLLAAAPHGAVKLALMWQLTGTVLHQGGAHTNGLVKNFAVAVGSYVQLGSAWKIASGGVLPPGVEFWMARLGWFFCILLPTQDFRDLEADTLVGRQTIPMLVSEWNCRVLMSVLHVVMPFVIHLCLLRGPGLLHLVLVVPVYVLLWANAWHIVSRRTRRDDKVSYKVLVAWYGYMLLAAGIVI
jgi:4-hydroxybenzoate polyprenyltransferase